MKTTLLIDSSTLCYKSLYALPPLSLNDIPIFIVYGFARQLLSLAKEFETNNLVFCWDSKENYRKKIYPKYKAKRKENKSPEEVAKLNQGFIQFQYIRRTFLPLLGFKNIFIQTGFEADDLIAHLINKHSDKLFTIVSSDSDLFQCLSDNVSMWNFKKLMTKKWFEKTYGIEPIKWIEAKKIGGCYSDSLPGIAGISDPAKSKAKIIPAVQIAAGLKVSDTLSKKYNDPDNQAILERNRELIALPLSTKDYQIKDMNLVEDEITRRRFIEVFDMLKFESFLYPGEFQKWVDSFKLS